MDSLTKKKNKELLLRDYRDSGKDLGEFALEFMDIYDEVCYEVKLINATSMGKRVRGTAVLGSCDAVAQFIKIYDIAGDYTIEQIDTQKEFFMLLEEIKNETQIEAPVLY